MGIPCHRMRNSTRPQGVGLGGVSVVGCQAWWPDFVATCRPLSGYLVGCEVAAGCARVAWSRVWMSSTTWSTR